MMRIPKKQKRVQTRLAVTPDKAYDRLLKVAIGSTAIPDKNRLEGALRARQYDILLEWSDRPSPQLYDSPAAYYADCQIAALIRKYPFTPAQIPGLNPEETAIKKFLAAEHKCKWQNRKTRAQRTRWDDRAQLKAWSRGYIERCIGLKPDIAKIGDLCDITSGASLGIHGNKTNIARKIFAPRWTVTPSALQYAIPFLWSNIQLRDCILPGAIKCYDPVLFVERVRRKVQFVNHNKISFVPKTAKTHRSIAVEPFLNGFIQKGTDQYMRQALKRVGIDLSSQTSNQVLANLGSRGGFNPYVTIDLAAASDSLSIEVVRDLVPPEWFEFLSEIRATHYMLPGESAPREYEKFCSMGNGFCFPLQTLIFASVCHAAAKFCGNDDDFSVYGDDIIVRQQTALLVIEILRDLGFRTNVDKTFVTGPFRESCGADWFEGQDVRPVHLDEQLIDVRQLFALHNSCLRSRRTELFTEQLRDEIRALGGGSFLRPGREPGDSAFSVPLDRAMNSPHMRWDRVSSRWQWKEIYSEPTADPGKLGEVERANALVLAVLRGSDSRKPFNLRRITRARYKRISRPYFGGFNQQDVSLLLSRSKLDTAANVRMVRKAVARYSM